MADPPGRPLDAVVHAAVLLATALLVTLATLGPRQVSPAAVLRLNLAWVIGTAVAAHLRPTFRTQARALAACAVLALLVQLLGALVIVGFEASSLLTGVATGSSRSAEQWAADHVRGFMQPSTYLLTVGSWVSLFLGSARRGAWTEGLALAAPSSAAVFAWNRLWNNGDAWELLRALGLWCLSFALLLPIVTRAVAAVRRGRLAADRPVV